jgi:glycerol-3-phosphate dehydrogenase
MEKTTVVVIGGGATGVGILRDLSMRGVAAVLLEARDLAYGTSSRFHGLLHSGGRYVVKDVVSARECISENAVLRKIAKYCVEDTEGFFVRLPEDDDIFEGTWLEACRQAGVPAVEISPREALRLEPSLNAGIKAVYRVPDAAIDGFRLCWQNAVSARRHGGKICTYTEVTGIEQAGGRITGVRTRNCLTGQTGAVACDFIVSAAGSWVGLIAALAGIDVKVRPDRGTLIAFNHRFTERVINRLRLPADGDIFVPHGSVTILGTTSVPVEKPDDIIPRTEEILTLLAIGEELCPDLPHYRILRAFAGTRPLYSAEPGAQGREASRNFTVIDHSREGLAGFASIVGGKLTTYRLMAEQMTDFVCRRLGVTAKSRTAAEPLIEDLSQQTVSRGRSYFPAHGADPAAARLGPDFAAVSEQLRSHPEKKQLICECEMVTLAELELVAGESTTFNLDDVRRRTRMGMGTCQGAFCALRGVGAVVTGDLVPESDPTKLLRDFLEARWSGIRPALWGNQLREIELVRGIYQATLNVDGAMNSE